MIQLIRNFSVRINHKAFSENPEIRFTSGCEYPVIGIEHSDGKLSCLIIPDDDGVANWLEFDKVKIVEVQP